MVTQSQFTFVRGMLVYEHSYYDEKVTSIVANFCRKRVNQMVAQAAFQDADHA